MAVVLHPHACLHLDRQTLGWAAIRISRIQKLRTITEQAMPAERSASTRSGMLARAQLGRSAAPPWDDERYPRRAPTHRTPVGPAPERSCASEPARFPENSEGTRCRESLRRRMSERRQNGSSLR